MAADVAVGDAVAIVTECGASSDIRQLVINKLEVNGGLIVKGDQYNVGQAGAVGPGARASDMTLVQGSSSISSSDDLSALAGELGELRTALRDVSTDPEHDVAMGIVAQAELKAKNGDDAGVANELSALKRLGQAGHWVLTAAAGIGTGLATAAIQSALGL